MAEEGTRRSARVVRLGISGCPSGYGIQARWIVDPLTPHATSQSQEPLARSPASPREI